MNADNDRAPGRRAWLVLGDAGMYLIVTVVGFGTHDSLAWDSLLRMLTTFIPFSFGWFLVAPWMGIFQPETVQKSTHLPRVLLAAFLAAPIGAFLRGLWLNAPILPVFVLVMAAVSMLGMVLWRAFVQFVILRSGPAV